MTLRILTTQEPVAWMNVLQSAGQYDFYHLPSYHALAERRAEGVAKLFVYAEGDFQVALPLLMRPVKSTPGLEHVGERYWDATSVYGYAGPITSHANLPEKVIQNFQNIFRAWLVEQQVVAVFSRLHPLLPQASVLEGLGQLVHCGRTISIDLTVPPAEQWMSYRKSHRYDIKKLKQSGMTCSLSQDHEDLADFLRIYTETMTRLGAAGYYFFDQQYFEELMSSLNDYLVLLVCKLEGQIVCGGLFALCNGIVQYHLSGSAPEFLHLGATKLLLDVAREWAVSQHAHIFHLGGGVGSLEDSLFQFKAGFSDRRHDFKLWRWIVDAEVYTHLCQTKESWNVSQGYSSGHQNYFPAYRAAPVPVETAQAHNVMLPHPPR